MATPSGVVGVHHGFLQNRRACCCFSESVLCARVTFLEEISVSNFYVTACRANVSLVLCRHLSWKEVRRKGVKSLHWICNKGEFVDPFAVLDLVTIVLSLERGHHRTLMRWRS